MTAATKRTAPAPGTRNADPSSIDSTGPQRPMRQARRGTPASLPGRPPSSSSRPVVPLRLVPGRQGRRHRDPRRSASPPHRPVGLRQVEPPPNHQPDERPRSRARASRAKVLYHGAGPVREGRRPGRGPPAHRHGVPEGEPVPQVDLRQRRVRPRVTGFKGQHGRARRVQPPQRAALWDEVKDKLQAVRPRALRRPAAAAVHRARHRHVARRDPDG